VELAVLMTKKKTFNLSFLRIIALLTVLIGTVGSLGLMFNAGRHQKSIILMALFTIWVLTPFVGLFIADKFSTRWSALTRVLLYCLMLVLSVISLLAYSGAFNTPETKNAFMFLVVPFVSWLLIVVFIGTVMLISRRQAYNNVHEK
jgi:hypothetical protein